MNDTVIATLMWLLDLSDEDKLIELKKDKSLCGFVHLYPNNFKAECLEYCHLMGKFDEL